MSAARPIFEADNARADADSLVRARADIAAGRVVPHGKVAEWLKAWTQDTTIPMPRASLR